MDNEITETREQLVERLIDVVYKHIHTKPLKIYEIFQEFFGEDLVDYQESYTKELIKDNITQQFLGYFFNQDFCENKIYLEGALLDNLEGLKTLIDFVDENPYMCLRSNDISGEILVKFPKVTITNENQKSITVRDLFVKIEVSTYGNLRGYPTFNKATYTSAEFSVRYIHSHVCSLNTSRLSEFQSCCLGDGPLVNTCSALRDRAESNLDNETLWRLFCVELSRYVTVESLAGGPYIRLERVLNYKETNNTNAISTPINRSSVYKSNQELFNSFFEYFINNNSLKFSFTNGHYHLGIPLLEYYLLISNSFIQWYNDAYNRNEVPYNYEDLLVKQIISKKVIIDNNLYDLNNRSTSNHSALNGHSLFKFKGETVSLNIDSDQESSQGLILIDPYVANYFLYKILTLLNYKYGHNSNSSEVSDSSDTTNNSDKKTYYL